METQAWGSEIQVRDEREATGVDKILIIQDSPSVNAMLKLRLESGGFSLETVETGEEGVEKAKAGQYQLILLDYNLPGIDGGEVFRILRGEQNTRNTPTVLMSAKMGMSSIKLQRMQAPMVVLAYPLRGRNLLRR